MAIILVVSFHTMIFSRYLPQFGLPAQVGYLGVDIFFVISGFCMALPYARSQKLDTTTPRPAEFWRHRFIRIIPSYLLALGVAALLVIRLSPTQSLAWDIAQQLLFIQNSFHNSFGAVNSSFWSLAVECQFYAIFPLLIAGYKRAPLLGTSLMVVFSLWYRLIHVQCCLEIETVMRQLPSYLDAFGMGMLSAYGVLAVRARSHTRPSPNICTAGAILTCMMIVGLLYWAQSTLAIPNGRELWQVFGRTWLSLTVAGFVVFSAGAHSFWRNLLGNFAFAFIAAISYNLYLWHTMLEIQISQHPAHFPTGGMLYALQFFASIAVATGITVLFERPVAAYLRTAYDPLLRKATNVVGGMASFRYRPHSSKF